MWAIPIRGNESAGATWAVEWRPDFPIEGRLPPKGTPFRLDFDVAEKIAWALSSLYFGWCVLTPSRYHLIDFANLGFHELGHLIFGMFGEFVMFLGGTIGQLAAPAIVVIYGFVSEKRFLSATGGAWLAQSMVNVSVYVGDARAQKLQLIGGEHDWNYLLSRLGLLSSDRTIALAIYLLALLVLLASVVLGVYALFYSGEGVSGEGARNSSKYVSRPEGSKAPGVSWGDGDRDPPWVP